MYRNKSTYQHRQRTIASIWQKVADMRDKAVDKHERKQQAEGARTKTRCKKKPKYIEYDYQGTYQNDLGDWDEWMVESLLMNGKTSCVYATKEIYAGDQLDIEWYPEFTRKEAEMAGVRPQDKQRQREAQRALDDRKSQQQFWRLAEHNFGNGDLWITLVYDDEHLPETLDEATKCIQRFLRNINGKRKRRGLPNAKYLYVTEITTEDGKPVRAHHHLFMDGMMDQDTVEATWRYGRRNNCRKVEKGKDGIEGAADYMVKTKKDTTRKKHKKSWSASLNLEKPIEKKHHRTRKKHIDKMVRDHEYIREYVEEISNRYAGYIYRKSSIYYNDHNARFYIRVRMRREDKNDKWQRNQKRKSHQEQPLS